jgi:nicotinamidase-related amidase
LVGAGVGHVVLGGVATNLVVESAARHASDCGLSVTVVEDMCASFRTDFHEFSVQHMLPLFSTVTSAAELIGTIEPAEGRAA